MADVASMVIVLIILIGPFVGYSAMLRRPDRTRGQLILAAMLGSGLPAALLGGATFVLARGEDANALLPWVAVASLYGAGVGTCGVVARIVGAWLSQRQP